MSQNYTINSYQADHVGQSDLQNMENNFECLRSMFSGAAAPSNVIAGMPWFDTTQNLFKIRNDANNAWYGVMCGDTSQKMLVYRNAAMDGWVIDSGVTDRVIAVKGGSTYTTGGAVAGSWTLPNHTLVISEMPSHSHTGMAQSDGNHTHTDNMGASVLGGSGANAVAASSSSGGGSLTVDLAGAHTHYVTTNNTGVGGSHNHGAAYRPAAAVVTIQFPDI